MGYTDDGIEADHTTTDKEIRVDEESDPVDVYIDKESHMVSLKMAEATLQNLAFAMSGSTVDLTAKTIKFGGKKRPNIYRLGFIGPSVRDPTTLVQTTREMVLFRVYSKGAIKAHYRRNDKVVYAVQFVALADSTQAEGERTGIYQDF